MATPIDGPSNARVTRPAVVEVRLPDQRVADPASRQAHAAAEAPAADHQLVVEASQRVEQFFQSVRRNLRFHEDAVSGRVVVSVIDADTGEIVRQIPPEQVVRMAERLPLDDGTFLGERA